MKLPDFLEELNQGGEKAFGENARALTAFYSPNYPKTQEVSQHGTTGKCLI